MPVRALVDAGPSFNPMALGRRTLFQGLAAVRPPLPFEIPAQVRSIVVFACTGIGSGLFCSAAIKSLKRAYPKARLSVVAHHKRMAVALHNPHADHVFPYAKSPFVRLKLLAALRRERPDLVVALRLNEDAVPLGYLANRRSFIGSARRCKSLAFLLSHRVEIPRNIHSTDEMLMIARAGGGSHSETEMTYEVTRQEEEAAARRFPEWISQPFIIWQVGASTRDDARVYPVELATKAVAALRAVTNHKIILTGGKEEADAAARMAQTLDSAVNICGQTTLEETAAVVQRARLVVSRDTGVMHLAVAVGTPTLALMHSSERVRLYGPPLKTGKNRVLAPAPDACTDGRHPMAQLAWTSVVDCVASMLSSQAHQAGCPPTGERS